MYDWAQREEDRPLAHETTRMPEKRVNAAHMALHHRTFLPRNAGTHFTFAYLVIFPS